MRPSNPLPLALGPLALGPFARGPFALVALVFLLAACAAPPPPAATVDEAKAFATAAETRLLALNNEAGRAGWVQQTYITDDTQALAAAANERLALAATELATKAARFNGLDVPEDVTDAHAYAIAYAAERLNRREEW